MNYLRNLILFLFLFQSSQAQMVNMISARVDKQRILIGEQINLTLSALVPVNGSVQWINIDTIPHFEIVKASKVDSQLVEKNVRLTQTLTLTSWDSGRWVIPSFSLAAAKNRKSEALMIDVGYTSADPAQDYHDIKDILEVPKPDRVTWYWYVIGAILLLLLFSLLFPTKKKEKVAAPIPDVDSYKKALAQLEALKTKTDGDVKAFYTELVDIFRVYIFQRKGLQSFQKTTDDLSVQIKSLNIPAEQYTALVQVLRLSDMVKFARFIPAETETKNALEIIKRSIIRIENKE